MGYSHLFQLGLAQKLEGAGIIYIVKFMEFLELGIMQLKMTRSI